jgi:hypothetical protein
MAGVPHYRLPSPGGARRVVARRRLLEAGRTLPFEPGEWARSLVVVERGDLELCWPDGASLEFGPGDVLCLAGLGLVALRAVGAAPTLLLIVRR